MLNFSQMMIRLAVALALGALMGLERELVGKEAGIRTSMLVAGGASIFTILALTFPYIIALSPQNLGDILARNSGFLAMAANIVVGIGFLGAGIIVKNNERVHGLTTAAVVWITAAIGALAGAGLLEFASAATLLSAVLLYLLRRIAIYDKVHAAEFDRE